MEVTFVNKDDIFQYYNDNTPADEMIFKRTPSQVGRNVELCHPPKYLDKVKTIMKGFVREAKTSMKCGSSLSREASLSTSPTQQCTMKMEEFQGVLEYVQDIQPYREIDTDYFRGLE